MTAIDGRAETRIGGTIEAGPKQRVAVVHEWLPARAGSEQVFEAMAQSFPDAELFALSRNPDVDFDLGGRPVRTTMLNKVMARRGGSAATLPLMPLAWKAMRTEPFDVVLTSTHAFSRAFPAAADALHLSYTHTPMRYVWSPELDHRDMRVPDAVLNGFRELDLRFAKTVDGFAANSNVVRDRIREFYDRDAIVLPPPVDTHFFQPGDEPRGDFLLSVSRLVPYKRHDLAIEAAALLDMPIVVAGRGPDEERLRALADRVHPGGVTFEVGPSRERLRTLFQRTQALLFPALEDFGIVPLEAQACGTPVVALGEGGSLDTVRHGETGWLAPEQTVYAFRDAVQGVLYDQPTVAACRAHAENFSPEAFANRLLQWVASYVDGTAQASPSRAHAQQSTHSPAPSAPRPLR